MKVVIFAGGFGTRISEETDLIPKPLVTIGGKPVLWHIMKIYSHYGFNEFIICLGYKGHMIKEWFSNYQLYNSDFTIDLSTNNIETHNSYHEDWKVTLVDTGLHANTATRLARIQKYINDDDFMLTYGDGVGDVNIKELVDYHFKHDKIATVTTVEPEGRFGSLKIHSDGTVNKFAEKIDNKGQFINAGFFVLNKDVFNYIPTHDVMWEQEPLKNLAESKQLAAYKHDGFWKPMDTLRDKRNLDEHWNNGNPPWKIWNN